MTDTFKVRLEPATRADGVAVVFHASPEITESRVVNYKAVEPVHMPGNFQAYNNSSSRTFSISAIKLFSRTPEEASMNLAKINQLRGWTVSKFGISANQATPIVNPDKVDQTNSTDVLSNYGASAETRLENEYKYYGQSPRTYSNNTSGQAIVDTTLIGLPPAVIELSAYSNAKHRGNIYRIPCVITNLSIPYPTDVDYIPTSEGTPFPAIMTISIELIEVHSPNEYQNFNIVNFRRGELLFF